MSSGAASGRHGVARAMDSVRNGREVRYENAGRLSFGRADNSVEDERVVRVRDALNAAGVANETPVQMLKEMWWKFMINVGVNQASAVRPSHAHLYHGMTTSPRPLPLPRPFLVAGGNPDR